jgi:hypothetical protein
VSFLSILYVLIWIVIGLGLIGAGVSVVRKANAGAGYVLAAAGLVALLATCCGKGLDIANDDFDETMFFLSSFVAWGRIVLVVLLAAVSLVLISNKIRAPRGREG